MSLLCHKVVPITTDENGRLVSNTYCMKPAGHKGKCEEVKVEEDVPMKKDEDDAQPLPRT